MANVTIVFKGYNSITQGYNESGYESDVAFIGLTGGLSSVAATGDTIVSPTGIAANATAGNTTETAGGGISVGVTGVGATASTNSASVWSVIDTSQTPNWVDIAA
tara:strand:- start:36 stop:350 length:315 start_codon:yes stop_codon:yes gene_type:complete